MEDPKDYVLYGVASSTGAVTRKSDLETQQKVFMTDWKGVQSAIKILSDEGIAFFVDLVGVRSL